MSPEPANGDADTRIKEETSFDGKIEIISSISDSQLTLILRKNTSGITQRLGSILLTLNDALELDTLSWTSTAVLRSTSLEAEVRSLSLKHESANQTIKLLNKQLEDLVAAKLNHENALLGKFKELLNAKKMKIRDQQRLLAVAKVERKRGEKIQSAGQGVQSRTPEQSRKGKRKANELEKEEDDDEEDAFEDPSSTHVKQEGDLSDEPVATPEASDDDVTEDEDDDLDIKPEDEEPTAKSKGGAAEGNRGDVMQLDTSSPARDLPPVRGLPFGKLLKGSAKPSATLQSSALQQQEADNDDEETDDDEL